MRYLALAADYDGTLAHHGVIGAETAQALERLKKSGRRLVMVTGRELEDLLRVCPQVELFDLIVAENGALVYHPETKAVTTLGAPPSAEFIDQLRQRGVENFSVGRVIVATWEPHQEAAFQAIQQLGLELQVIFNKGAVMVLPSGINKASGLTAALKELGLSPHNVVGVGDAENDHAFLSMCECSVAVANALPAIKERADFVTRQDHGAGVAELIDGLIADELAETTPNLARHYIDLGELADGETAQIDPQPAVVLVCGTSGSGKSTLTMGLLERLTEMAYQFVIIDPEGDYTSLEFATVLGSPQRAPLVEEVLEVLHDPQRSVAVNLLGVSFDHRPPYFNDLLAKLLELRTRTGRPHWLILDESHHLLPASWVPAQTNLPSQMHGAVCITVHPGSVAPSILKMVNALVVVGDEPHRTVEEFCNAVGCKMPTGVPHEKLKSGDAVFWRPGTAAAAVVRTLPPKTERKRHSRKYAEGNLGAEHSFFFRGPEGKLNLKAHNLILFLQMGEGVDEQTWDFHFRRHDYSTWLRDHVKDDKLAKVVAGLESDEALTVKEGRQAIRKAVEQRYTLPADRASGAVKG